MDENVLTIEKIEVKPPRLRVVKLWNDDYTPTNFVVYVLETIFHKSATESEQLMFKAHNDGYAIVGIYTKEIAETKMINTHKLATAHGHPLKATIEVS